MATAELPPVRRARPRSSFDTCKWSRNLRSSQGGNNGNERRVSVDIVRPAALPPDRPSAARQRLPSRRAAISDEEASTKYTQRVHFGSRRAVPAIGTIVDPLTKSSQPQCEAILGDHITILKGAQALEQLRGKELSLEQIHHRAELEQLIRHKSTKVVRDDCITAIREAIDFDNHLQTLLTEEEYKHESAKLMADSEVLNSKEYQSNVSSFKSNIPTLVKIIEKLSSKYQELHSMLLNCDRILDIASNSSPVISCDDGISVVISKTEMDLEHYRGRCCHWTSVILSLAIETMCIYFDMLTFEQLSSLCHTVEDFNHYIRSKPPESYRTDEVSVIQLMSKRQAQVSAKKIGLLLRGEANKVTSARKRRQLQQQTNQRLAANEEVTSDYFTGSEELVVDSEPVTTSNTNTVGATVGGRGVDLVSLLSVITSCNQRVLMKLIFASQKRVMPPTSSHPVGTSTLGSHHSQPVLPSTTTQARSSGRPTWARIDEHVARDHQTQYRKSDTLYWKQFWLEFASSLERELLTINEMTDTVVGPSSSFSHKPLTLCEKETGWAVVHAIERSLVEAIDDDGGILLTEDAIDSLSLLAFNLKYALAMRDWSREMVIIARELDSFVLNRSLDEGPDDGGCDIDTVEGKGSNRTRIGRAFISVIESLVQVMLTDIVLIDNVVDDENGPINESTATAVKCDDVGGGVGGSGSCRTSSSSYSVSFANATKLTELNKQRVTEAMQLTLNCLENWLRTRLSQLLRTLPSSTLPPSTSTTITADNALHAALILLLNDLEAVLVALNGHHHQQNQLQSNSYHRENTTTVTRPTQAPVSTTVHLLSKSNQRRTIGANSTTSSRVEDTPGLVDDDQEVACDGELDLNGTGTSVGTARVWLARHEQSLRTLRAKLLRIIVERLADRVRAAITARIPRRLYLRPRTVSGATDDHRCWLVMSFEMIVEQSLKTLLIVRPSRSAQVFKLDLFNGLVEALINVIVSERIKFSRSGCEHFATHVQSLADWSVVAFGPELAITNNSYQFQRLMSFVKSLQDGESRRLLTIVSNRIQPVTTPLMGSVVARNSAQRLRTISETLSISNTVQNRPQTSLIARDHRVNFLCVYCPSFSWLC